MMRGWICLVGLSSFLIACTAVFVEPTATTVPIPTPEPITLPSTESQTVWPIIDAASGIVLGGWADGAWLDAWAVTAVSQDQQLYQLYNANGLQGELIGAAPQDGMGACPRPVVSFTPPLDVQQDGIALMADWEVTLRVATALPLDTAVYIDEIAALLRENGIENPDVRLTAVDRVDLEGDGIDEVFIFAENLTGLAEGLPIAHAGDYTAVILRQVIDGEVASTLLQFESFPARVELVYPLRYEPIGYFDLNGNGRLDAVIKATGYEQRHLLVYESQPQGAIVVLDGDCQR